MAARHVRLSLVGALAIVLIGLLAWPATGSSYQFGPGVLQVRPEKTVFDWSTQRCTQPGGALDGSHMPDSPVRAFRDYQNRVQLILPSGGSKYATPPLGEHTRRMITPPGGNLDDLSKLAVDCKVVNVSHNNPDPASYDNWEWLDSVYTTDGRTVYGLAANSYYGAEWPGQCPSGVFNKCWYSSITSALSTDGGESYGDPATPPNHRVANSAFVYTPDAGPDGFFRPSNILYTKRPGDSQPYYYAMIGPEQGSPTRPQGWGACVVRTSNIADPTSWRAWNGSGFTVRFINPYTEPFADPAQSACTVVSRNQISKMTVSLTYNTYFKKYLLIDGTTKTDPATGQTVPGFYYSLSDDLVNWSDRQLLMQGEMSWTYQCGDDNPIAYPSLIDHDSTSRDFETTGQNNYLYFTRLNYVNCAQTADRDLIRIPIKFPTAYRFGSIATQQGPEQTVFQWDEERCKNPDGSFDDFHIPDSEVRAFRDYQNRVQLLIQHGGGGTSSGQHTRRVITPAGGSLDNLSTLATDCKVVHVSHKSLDPSSYDNWEWLNATYTPDGRTVYGLVHNEFHGWEQPSQCTVDNPEGAFTTNCWYNAITAAVSTNGGESYSHATPPAHRVASSAFRYTPNKGPLGYFQPSNILYTKRPGDNKSYYYVMVRAERGSADLGDPQQRGVCLLRTSKISDPSTWRGWDGLADDNKGGFTVRFADAYRDTNVNPILNSCAVVSPDGPGFVFKVGDMSGSLTYNSYFKKYMLMSQTLTVDPQNPAQQIWGVYYTLSSDLVTWDDRKLLMEAKIPWGNYQCGDQNPIAYPTVVDSNSPGRNFDTVDQTTYLYFTEFHNRVIRDPQTGNLTCYGSLDRDLIRIPIQFSGGG
jgi:hypothetical protein